MEAFLSQMIDKSGIFLFVGSALLVAAVITYKFPPKKINLLYGYRTQASMKNQAIWDFSQKYSSVRMFWLGLILLIITPINTLIPTTEVQSVILGLGLMVLGFVLLCVATERAIKKKFPNE
ncbi:MAG: SdpI family protein [Flavobacterium sp.]